MKLSAAHQKFSHRVSHLFIVTIGKSLNYLHHCKTFSLRVSQLITFDDRSIATGYIILQDSSNNDEYIIARSSKSVNRFLMRILTLTHLSRQISWALPPIMAGRKLCFRSSLHCLLFHPSVFLPTFSNLVNSLTLTSKLRTARGLHVLKLKDKPSLCLASNPHYLQLKREWRQVIFNLNSSLWTRQNFQVILRSVKDEAEECRLVQTKFIDIVNWCHNLSNITLLQYRAAY